jgi:hypothetical protein
MASRRLSCPAATSFPMCYGPDFVSKALDRWGLRQRRNPGFLAAGQADRQGLSGISCAAERLNIDQAIALVKRSPKRTAN